MTNKSKAKGKLAVWLISIFISFIPMLITSFASSIKFNIAFGNVFYSEFCKSSVLYISISSITSLIINCIINFIDKDRNEKFKWFDFGWLVFSIIFLLIGCALYGIFSIENLSNQYQTNNNQIDVNALFVTNLCVTLVFLIAGTIKHIIDIVKEK